MKRQIFAMLGFVLLLSLLGGCGGAEPPAPAPVTPPATVEETPAPANDTAPDPTPAPQAVELFVGAAASLTDVMEELGVIYRAENPHVTLEFIFASSGDLQTQIEQGAPIDVFMSAAMGQMNNLIAQDLIYGDSRNVVRNSIALIVPLDSTADIAGFEDVISDEISLIAIGDPESVPGGAFAREIFTNLGIFDEVLAKANLGTNIRQVLTWVEMGEADAGVVFGTDAGSSDAVRVIEIADSALHSPSVNPAGVVYYSGARDTAAHFIDFLFTPEARAIFAAHGFTPYE